MQDNTHNQSVEERLKDFTMDPSEPVWADIEKNLNKKKRRYIIGWWMLLPLLLIGTGLLLFINNDGEKERTETVHQKSGETIQQAINKDKNTGATIVANNSTGGGDRVEPAVTSKEKITQKNRTGNIDGAGNTSGVYNKKTKKTFTRDNTGNKTDDDVTGYSPDLINDKGKMAARIESSQVSNPDTTNVVQVSSDSLADNNTVSLKKEQQDKKTATEKELAGKKEKNKPSRSWQKQWTVNAGVTRLASFNIFSKEEVFEYNSGGIGSSPVRTRQEYEIKPGISAGAGILFARKLSRRFEFGTGIGYAYNSVEIHRTIITDSLVNGSTTDFYTTLSIETEKNKLQLHNINIPLLVTWYFPKAKINLTGGIHNRFVVAGNWKESSSLLGKKKVYMPSVYINPAVTFRHFNAGLYLNTGLQTFGANKRLMEYGLNVRVSF